MGHIMTELMTGLGYSSKTITERAFTRMLHEKSRHTAGALLTAHAGGFGRRSIADFNGGGTEPWDSWGYWLRSHC